MGIEYEIDAELGVIFAVGKGKITAKDISDTENRWLTDNRFRPGLNLLFDGRLAHLELSGADSRSLANRDAQELLLEKVCAVVEGGSFGVARMYQGWAGDKIAVHVVRDMASAREWLGLPPEEEQEDRGVQGNRA